jgi:hypothetical protein
VFELARGSLIRSGLALDRIDVGAVLNVLDNHLGLDGITTRGDLAQMKRLVVEQAGEMIAKRMQDGFGGLAARAACFCLARFARCRGWFRHAVNMGRRRPRRQLAGPPGIPSRALGSRKRELGMIPH